MLLSDYTRTQFVADKSYIYNDPYISDKIKQFIDTYNFVKLSCYSFDYCIELIVDGINCKIYLPTNRSIKFAIEFDAPVKIKKYLDELGIYYLDEFNLIGDKWVNKYSFTIIDFISPYMAEYFHFDDNKYRIAGQLKRPDQGLIQFEIVYDITSYSIDYPVIDNYYILNCEKLYKIKDVLNNIANFYDGIFYNVLNVNDLFSNTIVPNITDSLQTIIVTIYGIATFVLNLPRPISINEYQRLQKLIAE